MVSRKDVEDFMKGEVPAVAPPQDLEASLEELVGSVYDTTSTVQEQGNL